MAAAHPPDHDVVDRVLGGDENAFGEIVRRYQDRVSVTIRRMIGATDEVADVSQETFLRLYRSLGRYRRDAFLGTYITRIAMNESLRHLKRHRRWRSRFVSVEDQPAAAQEAEGEDGRRVVDARRDLEAIDRALQRLPAAHRAVIVLRLVQSYSTRETAEILGVRQGTVMSRLSRATKRLEELLAEGWREEP